MIQLAIDGEQLAEMEKVLL